MLFCMGMKPGHAIAQAVSRRLLTDEVRVRAQVGFVADTVALREVFLRVLRFFSVNIISPMLHIHSCVIWGMDNGVYSGQFHIDIFSPHRNNIQ
jgi:hypothetical protein